MSEIGDVFNKNTATVRPFVSEDLENGGTVYGLPYEIACTWAAKSEQRRDSVTGAEFVAKTLLWTSDARPQYRDIVQMSGVAGEYEVRSITNWDMVWLQMDPDFELGLV